MLHFAADHCAMPAIYMCNDQPGAVVASALVDVDGRMSNEELDYLNLADECRHPQRGPPVVRPAVVDVNAGVTEQEPHDFQINLRRHPQGGGSIVSSALVHVNPWVTQEQPHNL